MPVTKGDGVGLVDPGYVFLKVISVNVPKGLSMPANNQIILSLYLQNIS